MVKPVTLFKLLLCLIFVGFTAQLQAKNKTDNKTLYIDRVVDNTKPQMFLTHEDYQYPLRSSFKILNYVLMTNGKGERYATVTFENISDFRRRLQSEHVLGFYADGEQRHPKDFEQYFAAGEIATVLLKFNRSKFPLLQVNTLGMD